MRNNKIELYEEIVKEHPNINKWRQEDKMWKIKEQNRGKAKWHTPKTWNIETEYKEIALKLLASIEICLIENKNKRNYNTKP